MIPNTETLLKAIPKLIADYEETESLELILSDEQAPLIQTARVLLAEQCHQALCGLTVSCNVYPGASMSYNYPMDCHGQEWIVGTGETHELAKFAAVVDWFEKAGSCI